MVDFSCFETSSHHHHRHRHRRHKGEQLRVEKENRHAASCG
jgi:hypothetical protein